MTCDTCFYRRGGIKCMNKDLTSFSTICAPYLQWQHYILHNNFELDRPQSLYLKLDWIRWTKVYQQQHNIFHQSNHIYANWLNGCLWFPLLQYTIHSSQLLLSSSNFTVYVIDSVIHQQCVLLEFELFHSKFIQIKLIDWMHPFALDRCHAELHGHWLLIIKQFNQHSKPTPSIWNHLSKITLFEFNIDSHRIVA